MLLEQEIKKYGGIVVRPGLVYGRNEECALFGTLCKLVSRFPVIPKLIPAPVVQSVHVDALFTMINPNSKAARTCISFPLIRIPDKFLPHKTPIFFCSNGVEKRGIESDGKTHMTLADIDYF